MNRIIHPVLAVAFFITAAKVTAAPDPDRPFLQAESKKYLLPQSLAGARLKKICVDYNGVVYALSDSGLLRVCEDRLLKDTRYTPLAGLIPVDVTTQEQSGHLYYLYDDRVLTNGYAGKPYFTIPTKKFSQLAVDASGNIFLYGSGGAVILDSAGSHDIAGSVNHIKEICAYDGLFYAYDANHVYSINKNGFQIIFTGNDISSIACRKRDIVIGTPNGYLSVNRATGTVMTALKTKLPVPSITSLIAAGDSIWAGTGQGAFMENAGKFRYYASKRWLDEDEVKGIAADRAGNIFVLTANGVNGIIFSPRTLASKTKYFQDKIRQSHIRYGFISNVDFTIPGDRSTARLTDTDNDGLWSAFYLGSQAFRYAVTKDPDAKRYAWEAFEAFERIISINPLKGFPARTFERKGFKNSDTDRWHDSQEEGWEWKGTTSSDEFVGYIWVAAVMSEMTAETKEEKHRVAAFIDKILTHILDNDYYFIDADGKPTLWGRWNPEYINSFPKTVGDRRLGSTTIIAGLQLGYKLTGNRRFRDAAINLLQEHGYLENIQLPYRDIGATKGVIHMGIDLGDGGWNHSDDEMAFLTYWVLYRYAFDTTLKKKYAAAILDHWQIEKPEKNPVWNMVALGTVGVCDKPSTLWMLREFPLDLVRWDVKNSHRKDIGLLPPNFRNQYTKELLPLGELPIHRHNANAFTLDGGEHGLSELAGDEYLLPYWMARYLKVIQ